MFDATLAALQSEFAGRAPDTTEENIQSRCRGVLLMAISNKTGRMLLTTGNKSEMAVGYATLYGDMAGGFAPIKDCSKMLVYRLARYRNCDAAGRFRQRVHRRGRRRPSCAPTRRTPTRCRRTRCSIAILEAFIEEDLSVDEIVARGFDARPSWARARPGEAQRIQAPAGAAGRARERPRLRPRLALSDHQRLSDA